MITQQPIGRAVLYVLSNVRPQVQDAFNSWCDSIHHFDTMRIEGFLSLRRFEASGGHVEAGAPEYHLLTLYQIADPVNADFSTPAYQEHTATYSPPPDGVTDGIEFERHILRRRIAADGTDTQPVGSACVTLAGTNGPWLLDAAAAAQACDGVLNTYLADGDDRSILFVDVQSSDEGAEVLTVLSRVPHGGDRRSLQLFRQVFPERGVLGRDRHVITPDD